MTVVARRIIATPARSASAAWAVIVNLLAPEGGPAGEELFSVSGAANMLVADECLKDSPAVVYGSGPRVRLYCLYDEEAVIGDQANESKLAFVATDGDWKMSLPCRTEDLGWVQAELGKHSTRIVARDLSAGVDEAGESSTTRQFSDLIDREAFNRQ